MSGEGLRKRGPEVMIQLEIESNVWRWPNEHLMCNCEHQAPPAVMGALRHWPGGGTGLRHTLSKLSRQIEPPDSSLVGQRRRIQPLHPKRTELHTRRH